MKRTDINNRLKMDKKERKKNVSTESKDRKYDRKDKTIEENRD